MQADFLEPLKSFIRIGTKERIKMIRLPDRITAIVPQVP